MGTKNRIGKKNFFLYSFIKKINIIRVNIINKNDILLLAIKDAKRIDIIKRRLIKFF